MATAPPLDTLTAGPTGYVDVGAAGNTYFYAVCAEGYCGALSDWQNSTGAFTFALTPGY